MLRLPGVLGGLDCLRFVMGRLWIPSNVMARWKARHIRVQIYPLAVVRKLRFRGRVAEFARPQGKT